MTNWEKPGPTTKFPSTPPPPEPVVELGAPEAVVPPPAPIAVFAAPESFVPPPVEPIVGTATPADSDHPPSWEETSLLTGHGADGPAAPQQTTPVQALAQLEAALPVPASLQESLTVKASMQANRGGAPNETSSPGGHTKFFTYEDLDPEVSQPPTDSVPRQPASLFSTPPAQPLLDLSLPKQPTRFGRGNRVALQLPVLVRGRLGAPQAVREETHTLFVLSRGAVISLAADVRVGEKLVLINLKNGKETACQVVSVQRPETGISEVELGFTQSASQFWPVSFPLEGENPDQFNLPRPQERARPGVASSPPAPSASSLTGERTKPAAASLWPNDIRARLRTSALAVADSAAEEQRVDSVPPAVQVVPVGEGDLPAAKASASTASRSPLGAIEPLAVRSHEHSWEAGIPESWLDQRAVTKPAAANRLPRRKLILAGVSICLFILVPAAWFVLRHHSGSQPVAVNSSAVPAQASSESAATPSAETAREPAAAATQPPTSVSPAGQVSAQTQAMVATVAGSREPPKDSTDVPRAPAAPGKPASPRAKPEMRLGTLTVPVVAPTRNKVANEEPLPVVVDGDVPGAVPGGQPGGIIGILSKGSPASVLPLAQSSQHGGRIVQPRLASSVKPDYPPMARLQRVEGDVVIQAEISATGSVGLLKVVSGPVILQQAAMEALRKWKYEPARLNDQPVALPVLVTIRFRIK